MTVAEKINPGESPAEAAERGVREELGGRGGVLEGDADIQVLPDTLQQWEEVMDAVSYPGLLTREERGLREARDRTHPSPRSLPARCGGSGYRMHRMDAVVAGLPERSKFVTSVSCVRFGSLRI